jgi:uncharacterized protein DUF2877
VIAHVVAAPVLERLAAHPAVDVSAAPVLERLAAAVDVGAARRGRNGHVGRDAAYVDLDGFVIAVTGPRVPLMPNGIALTAPPTAGTVRVDGAHVWEPTLRRLASRERGEDILRALGPPAADHLLRRALAERDPALAARAADALIGRGPGLTPEGDDMLAATAAVVATGPWPADQRDPWLRALLPPDLRRRTTALSATLLELAVAGAAIEPLHALLAPGDGWRGALQRLLRVGHSTGRAYAVAAAYAAASCTS